MTKQIFKSLAVTKHRNLYIIRTNNKYMNKWAEILFGLIFMLAAVLAAFYLPSWFDSAISLLKGAILWFVLGIGLILLMLGISELKG